MDAVGKTMDAEKFPLIKSMDANKQLRGFSELFVFYLALAFTVCYYEFWNCQFYDQRIPCADEKILV